MFVKSVNCITEIDQLIVYSASDYNSKGFFFLLESVVTLHDLTLRSLRIFHLFLASFCNSLCLAYQSTHSPTFLETYFQPFIIC